MRFFYSHFTLWFLGGQIISLSHRKSIFFSFPPIPTGQISLFLLKNLVFYSDTQSRQVRQSEALSFSAMPPGLKREHRRSLKRVVFSLK